MEKQISRHDLRPKQEGLTVTVGWDRPLQTFFAQVLRQDENDNDDPVVLWLGTLTDEYPAADGLVAPLQPYAVLDATMLAQLRADRAEEADRMPSPLQRLMRE